MNCVSCGHEIREGARFCEECGAPLLPECTECGARLRHESKFCDACGTRVISALAPAHAEKLRRSTPRHIAEAARRDHVEMEGERRVVTVLFADAVGHTVISEKLGDEEVYNLMQGCFERMQDAVHAYEGTVNQFTGDGIFALFGAPIAHEDSARRAVAAALEMQKSLGEYASEMEKRYSIECSYRVGLNTGPVVIGKISDDTDLNFTALGDTVNLAARMESMAEPGTVYLTENTHRVVRDYFECESLGELHIKGKAEPVPSYRAIREKAHRQRIDVASEHGLSSYVGRDQELNVLEGYLKRVKRDQGQVVFVSGDAGMGKSRLLLEFKNSLALDGRKWLEGHCVSYGRSTPYLPFTDILKQSFAIGEGDTETVIIDKVADATAEWSPAGRDTVPYLKYLLHVDPGSASVTTMDPLERKAGILDGLRSLILEERGRGPLVLVVEDLHWIDEKSEEALARLVDMIVDVPVLLLLTSRPAYGNRFGGRSYFNHLALDHLQGDETATMVESVLKSASLPATLLELITSKAEGNPFYIEEVTKSLVESGILRKHNGSYSLERPAEEIRVPDTIQEVILARLDRLDSEAKGAMQLASVIGREFTARLLRRISHVEDELDDLLSDLKSLELIYQKGYVPELSYMFKHALTHDVAYSTLLVEKRRSLHHIVAVAIEDLYPERLVEHYEALAHHYEEGHTWGKALDYLEKAGDKAVQSYANDEAVDYYGRALEVCTKLEGETHTKIFSIAEKRAWVNFTLADYSAAIADANVIIETAKKQEIQKTEGRALALRGMFETYLHEFETAETTFSLASDLAKNEGFEDISFVSEIGAYNVLKLTNRHEEAKKLFHIIDARPPVVTEPFALSNWTLFSSLDENWKGRYSEAARRAAAWRQFPPQTPQVMILIVRWSEALIFAAMGKYTEAIKWLQEIEAECERMGEVAVRARALNTLGWIHGDLQGHSRAIEFSHRGVEVALVEGDEPEKISNARLNWVDVLVATGRYGEAHKLLVEIEPVIRNPKPQDRWMLWRFSQHFYHSYGALCLAEEETEKAISLSDECLQLAEHSDSKKYIVMARRLRGLALLAQGDGQGAVAEMNMAIQTATAIGNPPQLWTSFAALGEVHKAQGRRAEALEAYDSASKVIDDTAENLQDESLRKTLLSSEKIRAIRASAEG